MGGWVSLAGWPIANSLPTKWSAVKLSTTDPHRSGKLRRKKDRRLNHWDTSPARNSSLGFNGMFSTNRIAVKRLQKVWRSFKKLTLMHKLKEFLVGKCTITESWEIAKKTNAQWAGKDTELNTTQEIKSPWTSYLLQQLTIRKRVALILPIRREQHTGSFADSNYSCHHSHFAW